MKKKRILVLSPNPVGYAPGQRLRYEQYLDSIREAGYEVNVSSFITESFQKIVYKKGKTPQKIFWTMVGYLRRIRDLFRLHRYDAVYIFLWVTPFGPPVYEYLVRKLSAKLIYDIDDLIYIRTKSTANPVISNIKGKNKPVYLFRNADHVITSTIAIEEFARKFNSRVTNIPVSINTGIYTPKPDYAVKGNKIILGWSGSLSTSPYMHLLDSMLIRLSKSLDFKLVILGDADFKIDGVEVEALAWTEEREVPTIRSFDIGLYPLPDEEWVHGKGGGKALQYMALGVPVVATAIGMNFKIIQNDVNGFLVSSDEEWIQVIQKLAESEELRRRVGSKGVEVVESIYSVNVNKATYISIIKELIN